MTSPHRAGEPTAADRREFGTDERGACSADGERGAATVWVLACCVLLLTVAGVATARAAAVVVRHRAESSADLAALAGAGQIGVSTGICPAAARTARRNGAQLRSCRTRLAADGRSGTVTVQVVLRVRLPLVGERNVVASARAGRLLP